MFLLFQQRVEWNANSSKIAFTVNNCSQLLLAVASRLLQVWVQYKLIVCSSQLNSLSVISPCIWIMWACTAISLDTFLRFATAVCIYCIIMWILRLLPVIHTKWCRLMTAVIVYIIVCMSFELQVRCQQEMLRLGSPVDEGCLMKLQDRITLLRYDDESTFRAMPSVEVVAELEEKEKYKYTIDSVNNSVTLYLAPALSLAYQFG